MCYNTKFLAFEVGVGHKGIKGFSGPSGCSLCYNSSETINHMMLQLMPISWMVLLQQYHVHQGPSHGHIPAVAFMEMVLLSNDVFKTEGCPRCLDLVVSMDRKNLSLFQSQAQRNKEMARTVIFLARGLEKNEKEDGIRKLRSFLPYGPQL